MTTASKEKIRKFKVLNIVLYPTEKQKPIEYKKVFEQIYKQKLKANTYSDRYTLIRTQFHYESVIYGFLSNAIFIDPDKDALDTTTNEFVLSNIDSSKGYMPKDWDYWFFPEYHRLVFPERASETQIEKFFNETFCTIIGEGNFKINIEKDQETIEQILNASTITRLYVKISYSNNDNVDKWEKLIDDDIRASESKDIEVQASGKKNAPIQLSKSNMLTSFVNLSRSNGIAIATTVDENGKTKKIDTTEHPLIKSVKCNGDNIIAKLTNMIRQITGRN